MTITLNLSPEQEARIRRRALKSRMTPEQYLLKLADVKSPKRATRKSGAAVSLTWGAQVLSELKADDVLGSYGDPKIDSPELARQLRQHFSQRNAS